MLINSYQQRCMRSQAKRETVLRFLRDETWSNLTNLADMLGLSEPATFKTICQMERDGFLLRYKVDALRLSLWGVTPQGLAFAWADNEAMRVRPYFEPGKLSVMTIPHYLDIQRARLMAEQAGWTNWVPGHRLPKGIKKRPDAIATNAEGQTIAIELERSIKTLKRYEAIFAIYLQMMKREEYAKVHYLCPDAGFAPRLERMFALIQSVPVAGERVPITKKHRARFPVFALDNWPPEHPQNGMTRGVDGK
ncbi:hypothetical protein SAMN05192560_2329 [Methylobacillus rhizosphaerae]|uniref:Replication-relaxation n=1 Tax=Methylobacillus rhizosphaerae TaxID=551994 RepID=A0A239B7W8_9PROT|nr:MobC family replication-relaxation protein [Methylobacillus rhizosphaerae]SNS03702.1 hypothetical protein SAMN05192560_2329 [Methylobacillus rhizosphaerae]